MSWSEAERKMPEYNVVLAGRYGVGKSSLFNKLRTGEAPEGVTEGVLSTKTWTWGEDDGLDNYVHERKIDGRDVRVSCE